MLSYGAMGKSTAKQLFADDDLAGLVELARRRPTRVLRHLVGRVYSHDPAIKQRAVAAIGGLAATPEVLDEERVLQLARRFVWSMSDESGAVPFGIPEALGELLAQRSELRAAFVPVLGSFLTAEDLLQTGPIEAGVVWGLGRIGPPVAELAPHAVEALEEMRATHPEPARRAEAEAALASISGDRK